MENKKKELTQEQKQVLISELKEATSECVIHVTKYIDIIQEAGLQNEQFPLDFVDALNVQSARI